MKTLIHLFEESVNNFADNTFLWEKKNGVFSPITYKETQKEVDQLAAGLMAMGVAKGDKVALLSEGRVMWIIAELAILHAGATNVPLSVKLEESNDLLFRLKHSETKYIIVSESQLRKVRAIIEKLPLIEKVIILDEQAHYQAKEIFIDKVSQLGDSFLTSHNNQLKERAHSVKPDDMATISYTSGTTADPKGVMLSHRNYTANVEQTKSVIKLTPEDSNLIILPLDHCFAHVAGFYTFMAYGANVGLVEQGKNPMASLRNIPINIQEFKPTVIMSVPALAKSFKKNIENYIRSLGIYREFEEALKIAIEYNKEGFNKKNDPKIEKQLKDFSERIFSKAQAVFGGRFKFFIGGGALLDIDLQRFFYAIGLPMFQGYGLSEATPVISSNSVSRHKLGSSGNIVKPLEIKICDENGKSLSAGEKGEIVIKGENVMLGYYKNQSATDETVIDEWLHTGDMGFIDNDGFLYVLGRFKSLLIGSDGEKYTPEGIEESIVERSKYINQVILHNNQDPYTVALVVPNKETLAEYVQTTNPSIEWESDEAKIIALNKIKEDIDNYKNGGKYVGEFPERWLPTAIAILPEGFTEQNQMLNSTSKVVRKKVEEVYKDRLYQLYSSEGKNIVNKFNLAALA